MKKILFTILFMSFFYGQSLTIPSGVKIEMSGEVEMEFIDVEGEGGASNEDNFLKKIETRSPHTRIDKAVLDFKMFYSEDISYRIVLILMMERVLLISTIFYMIEMIQGLR